MLWPREEDRWHPPGMLLAMSSTAIATRGRRLGEILVGAQVLEPGALTEALDRQHQSGKRLGTILVEMGALDDHTVVAALAAQLGLPVADLRHRSSDPDALAAVPEDLARRLSVLPLRRAGDGLEVAVADPLDAPAMAELAHLAGSDIHLLVASPDDVRQAIDRCYGPPAAARRGPPDRRPGAAHRARSRRSSRGTPGSAGDAVQALVAEAVRLGASHVHIEPLPQGGRVRCRVDGVLRPLRSLPAGGEPALVREVMELAGLRGPNAVAGLRGPNAVAGLGSGRGARGLDGAEGCGRFRTTVDDRSVDVGVATATTVTGERVVLTLAEILPRPESLADVGFPPELRAHLTRFLDAGTGMVVVAGPAGSGRTTTLYAALAEVDSPERNITTVERSVAHVVPGVNQLSLPPGAEATLAPMLASVVRQDPDVVVVDEIDVAATAGIAARAAFDGGLVLAAVDATDAADALGRLLEMEVEPFLVGGAVVAVVGQRLLRRTCAGCRAPYRPSPAELELYALTGCAVPEELVRGTGCEACSGRGYAGRVGAYELLTVSEDVKRLVLARAEPPALRAAASEQGMVPLGADALRLVGEGETTLAEVAGALLPR